MRLKSTGDEGEEGTMEATDSPWRPAAILDPGEVAGGLWGGLERVSATMLSVPGMCRTSAVNSAR
jgi:hypothetical protein